MQYAVIAQHSGVTKTLEPETYVTDEDSVIYTEIVTDSTGVPQESRQVVFPVGSPPSQQMWDIKLGLTGKMYIPSATTTTDPLNGERKLAVKHRPHQLQAITQDASWTPDKAVGTDSGGEPIEGRSVQGINIVTPLDGNTTPAKGVNNHGGVKILGDDANGKRKSVGLEASIEMYGIAGSPYEAVGT